ncbi:hypothetical protein P280DRAFT_478926 [Massarina eburnea CBS 473.64]|uniref:Uncharacterized protein n=1 Tax=Massarina eburnea CBS 473.64 TaxID=1395130 RepID=A0A6A6S4N3_9PLEO|nr:hypothetical protein P280DRAFT_478926 [Massarina eburnea CBS 473.64]
MRFSTAITTLALAAAALAAPVVPNEADQAGPAFWVKNNCDSPVWVTSIASVRKPTQQISAHTSWHEPLYRDPRTGTSVQVTTTAGLDGVKPILNAAYTYNAGDSIYYNLSPVNNWGYAFSGAIVKFFAPDDFQQAIIWDKTPAGQVTKAYFGETDLILELCDQE